MTTTTATPQATGGAGAAPTVAEIPRPAGFMPFEAAVLTRPVTERFAEMVRRDPRALAVRDPKRMFSYGELDALTDRVAAALQRHPALAPGARPDVPLAVLCGGGTYAVVGMLAALKVGRAYLPLDAGHPAERLAWILERTDAPLILGDATTLELARRLGPPDLPVFDLSVPCAPGGATDAPTRPAPVTVSADDPCCVLFTSGSTGRPKGVIHTHRTLLHNVMKTTQVAGLAPGDRISLLSWYGTGAAGSDIWGALLNGAALLPFAPARDGLPACLEWILAERLTVLHMVPSLFRRVATDLNRNDVLQAVRVVKLGGETITADDVRLFQKKFPAGSHLWVGLGSTEVNVLRACLIPADGAWDRPVVPVGREVADTEILLLDDDGAPVPPGETGEIVVRSRYLPPGYWREPELTAAGFSDDPAGGGLRRWHTRDLGRLDASGDLEHRGRKDERLKVRGQSVELTEVERALARVPDVAEAACAGHPDRRGETMLVGYVVAAPDAALSAGVLRDTLSNELPPSLVPARFVELDALPRLPNGKLDRRGLPPPAAPRSRAPATPPRDDLEARLLEAWRRVLADDELGIDDDFFVSGGDSLQAMELFTRLEHLSGRAWPVDALMRAPTVRAFAGLLREAESQDWTSLLVPLRTTGGRRPFFCVHRDGGSILSIARLARLLPDDQPVYALHPDHDRDAAAPSGRTESVEDMAARYVEAVRTVQPHGPYRIGGRCVGGTIAYEMAQQLLAAGEVVERLVIVDMNNPPTLRDAPGSERLRGAVRSAVRHVRALRDRVTRGGDGAALRHQRARDRYRARPYPGAIDLLRAESSDPDQESAWRRLALGGLHAQVLPGTHRTILREPHVRETAARLDTLLGGDAPLGEGGRAPDPRPVPETAIAPLVHDGAVLMPLRAGGSRRPFFCVHRNDGSVLSIARLARRLDAEQPVWALGADGTAMGPMPSIPGLARTYVEAIRQVQPRGPYRLGGRCVGGTVAVEMARQLMAAGEAVELVAIIDVRHPLPLGLRDRWAVLREQSGSRRETLRRFVRDAARHLGLQAAAWRDRLLRRPVSAGVRLIRARLTYRARPYSGRIHLFRSEASRSWQDPGWRRVAAGGLETIVVPGTHKSILHEPQIHEVARRLDALLAEGGGR